MTPPADVSLTGVKDCPVTGTKLPLVIFSHGRGGWFGANDDTAEALADAGFVVAAINHAGDNGNDPSQRNKMSVWASRPVEMARLLDFMLHDWKDKAVIDPARIGFFGFSLGGYTGLVLAGAHADFRRLALFCKATDKGENCERARSGDVPPSPQPDPRIRAAVLADAAMTFAFTPGGLSGIRIPLQIWRSELGGNGVGSEFDRAHRQRTAGHAGNPHRSSRPLYVSRAVLAATRGGRATNLHRRACELRQNGLSP